jgi:hypothetical protein
VLQDLFNVTQAKEALAVRDQLRPIAQRLAAFTIALTRVVRNRSLVPPFHTDPSLRSG